VIRVILLALLGYLGHQVKPITDQFEPAFDRIANYAVGVAMLGSGMLIVRPRREHMEFLSSFSFVSVMLGFGVCTGYVVDKLKQSNPVTGE